MIINRDEYVRQTMKFISKYFEKPDRGHTFFYQLNSGYKGSPKPIHLGVGDKFLIHQIIQSATENLPEKDICLDDPHGFASWIQHFDFNFFSPEEYY